MTNLDKTWSDLQKQWDIAANTPHFRDYIAQGYNEETIFKKIGEGSVNDLKKCLEDCGISLKHKCLLELGCGPGRMTEFLALEASYIYAVDISPKMIKRFKERLGDIKNVKTIGGVGNLKMFETNSIDIILSILVFQHNPENIVKDFINGAWRILTHDGFLVFQLPLFTEHKVIIQPTARAVDMVYWTMDEVEKMAKDYFYEIIKKPQNGSNYFIFKKKHI